MNIAKVYDANVYVNNASKHGLASEMQDEKNVQDKVKKQMQIRGKKLDKDW